MIKLNNVNKYFFKNKKNQIHVINNVNLEFKNNGLVAILGNSGCGKTTLLNTIGGLDKINKGKIFVNGKKITKVSSGKIDKIRAINIGYIFQNYNLINYLTVFENVALALKISGIKNKKEIEKRVNYILNVLGIYKYRNRLANMLSGGERQRVAIARAIVKNPNIIIADEPTGNLDSKNSLEIMNIIKAISKDKLVILVTHERNLAEFYASRIIEIVDGKVVSDKENNHQNELDYRLENKIYLKDIKNFQNIKKENFNINLYTDSNNQNVNLDIVFKNNNLYIKTEKKAEIIEENSSVEFVNDHYKKISKEEMNQYNFDYNKTINKKYKNKYTSIYNIGTLLTNGIKKVFGYSILKKFLLLGFMASAMFILYGISNILGNLEIKDEDFISKNTNYLEIIMPNIDIAKYEEYEKIDSIKYMLPGNSLINFYMNYNYYYQTQNSMDTYKASLSSLELINEDNLIYGTMAKEINEVIVDKMTIEKILNNTYTNAKQVGLINIKDFINKEISFNNDYKYDMNSNNVLPLFKIVGIVDLKSPSLYINKEMFINVLSNTMETNDEDAMFSTISISDKELETQENLLVDINLKKDEIEITKGRLPKNDYEIIVNESNLGTMKLNKKIDKTINNNKLTVVGFYKSKYDMNYYFSNLNTIKYNLLSKRNNIIICPNNKQETINYFIENGIIAQDTYQKSLNEYKNKIKDQIVSSIVVASIIIGISLIEIYLMMRSSFLSRVKEVGILRAIGVKKIDIYKMFLGEILTISISMGTIGIILMANILKGLTQITFFNKSIMINWQVILLSGLLFLSFNIIVGLIPVYKTIKQTPAQILSSNNID